jgi:hypothetical protein
VTRRVVLIVAVALVAFTVGSAAPSGAGTVGGTTVSTSGPATTLTVHLDICCSSPAQHAEDVSLFNAYATQAANLWNQAFAKLLAQGCDLLHLSIDVHVLNTGDPWEPGFDQITSNFDKPGRDGIDEPVGSTLPATSDWTEPYTSTLMGHYFVPDLTARIFAHETGHLLGLGDDYTDQYLEGIGPTSVDLPGREGTLMDGGDTIDQNLVDRIAAQVEKAGDTLPTCQHWSGTIHTQYIAPDGCASTIDATLVLAVRQDGTVAGTYSGAETSPCPGSPGTFSIGRGVPITGSLTATSFVLTLVPSTPYTTRELPVSIPLVSRDLASAQLHGSGGGFSESDVIRLTCSDC